METLTRCLRKISAVILFPGFICLSCSQERPSGEGELRTVRVGIIPIAEVAQLYVGIDRGIFERHGIELDLVPMAGGAKILEVLGPNGVDLGFSNIVSLILFRSHGREYVALGGGTYETPQHINHAILVRDKDKLKTPKDLAGKKIAVNTLRNIEELMAIRFLEANGVDPTTVEFQAVPFPVMPTVLSRGDVDAISVVEPFLTMALRVEEARVLRHQYLALTDRAMVATYVTYEKFIENNPQLIQDFLAAFREATDYLNSHPGETRRIIGDFTNMSRDLLPEIGIPQMTADIDEDMLEAVAKDLHERGWANRQVSVQEILYKGGKI